MSLHTEEQLNKALILHYSMNNLPEKIIIDNSGNNGSSGNIYNIKEETNSPRNSKGFKFNNSYIWLEKDPIGSSTTEFSFSFWMKYNDDSTGCLWNGRDYAGNSIGIFRLGSGLRFDVGTQTQYSGLSTGKWYHLVFTWKKGGKKRIYVNGKKELEVNALNFTAKSNTKACIGMSVSGNNAPSGNSFNGSLSDYRIYNIELSIEDIQELYTTPIKIMNSNKSLVINGEFIEGSTPSFNKNGNVLCNRLREEKGTSYIGADKNVHFEEFIES